MELYYELCSKGNGPFTFYVNANMSVAMTVAALLVRYGEDLMLVYYEQDKDKLFTVYSKAE